MVREIWTSEDDKERKMIYGCRMEECVLEVMIRSEVLMIFRIVD